MRVVLFIQLGWSRLLRESLAQLSVLAHHLDRSGALGAWFAIVPGGVCWRLLAYERRVTRAVSDVPHNRRCFVLLVVVVEWLGDFDSAKHVVLSKVALEREWVES